MAFPIAGFQLPLCAPGDRLGRIYGGVFGVSLRPGENGKKIYWTADYFGLSQVSLFQQLTAPDQENVLAIANRQLLEEIYWVEQAGVGYMAKMVLLAETVEERSLYALFAADEAQHLAQISRFCPQLPVFQGDSFLELMASFLASDDKALLLTMVQVLLEGWGLSHYRSLAKHCQEMSLQTTLQGFLQAEARHHGAGLTQLQKWRYSDLTLQSIEQGLKQFLPLVQAGPQRLLSALDQVSGPLSQPQKVTVLEQLAGDRHSQQRLNLLLSLLDGTVPPQILQNLHDQGYFQPYTATQAASLSW